MFVWPCQALEEEKRHYENTLLELVPCPDHKTFKEDGSLWPAFGLPLATLFSLPPLPVLCVFDFLWFQERWQRQEQEREEERHQRVVKEKEETMFEENGIR